MCQLFIVGFFLFSVISDFFFLQTLGAGPFVAVSLSCQMPPTSIWGRWNEASKQKSIDITQLGEVNLDVKNSQFLFLFFGHGLFLMLSPGEIVTQLAEATFISRPAFKMIWFRAEMTSYSFENIIGKLLTPFPSSTLFNYAIFSCQ